MKVVKTLDRPPAGWFVIDVLPIQRSRGVWAALMTDVHPDELKHCKCQVAMLYVDPAQYRPGSRVAHECWSLLEVCLFVRCG